MAGGNKSTFLQIVQSYSHDILRQLFIIYLWNDELPGIKSQVTFTDTFVCQLNTDRRIGTETLKRIMCFLLMTSGWFGYWHELRSYIQFIFRCLTDRVRICIQMFNWWRKGLPQVGCRFWAPVVLCRLSAICWFLAFIHVFILLHYPRFTYHLPVKWFYIFYTKFEKLICIICVVIFRSNKDPICNKV